MSIIIPMAGFGQRFQDAGYTRIKPLIDVTHYRDHQVYPMVVAATHDLVQSQVIKEPLVFIYRNHPDFQNVPETLRPYFQNAHFHALDEATEGQACTCLTAKPYIKDDEPIFIGACDNGMVYDTEAFMQLKKEVDCIVFTFTGDPVVEENPDHYGWVKHNNRQVKEVSVKVPISDTSINDQAIVGTFWFRSFSLFESATQQLVDQNIRINNEFYIDSVINKVLESGKRVEILPVSKYLCWGTPQAFEQYEKTVGYWKSYSEKLKT